MENKKKNKNKTLLLLLLFVLFIYILFSTGFWNIDINSYGHGKYAKSSSKSIMTSLGISPDPDYVDEETGEEICFETDCWIRADEEFESCLERLGYHELDMLGIYGEKKYSYFEIIPAVSAIGMDELPDEIMAECEEIYDEILFGECPERCEDEIYIWDGSPISNLGEFSEEAFPGFIRRSQSSCSSWLSGGTWISQEDKVGCEGSFWIFCDMRSIQSAGEVCEQIGKEWTCNRNNATCSD